MARPWFHRWGWLHLPGSLAGTLAGILPVAFWIQVSPAADRYAHSAGDTLYGIFPWAVPSFLLYRWLASRTSPLD